MTKASRPLPTWLKWLMRILGSLLIASSAFGLFMFSLAILAVSHSKEGLFGASGEVLGGLVGQLVGILLVLLFGIWLLRRPSKKTNESSETNVEETPAAAVQEPEVASPAVPAMAAPRSVRNKNWQICNVLQVSGEGSAIWQFDAQRFNLTQELRSPNGNPLPLNVVGKSWGALFKSKLNVAWLPAEHVFLRVAQFPASTPDETRAMVELQLEKLSPIPVTQALWTMHVLPTQGANSGQSDNLQTIVVIIVARNVVEEFLGKLEGQGYMADRLELPMLDQLQATPVIGDGAWVYPETNGVNSQSLVAWWYGGVLQNVALLTLESGPSRIASLKDQLVQMTWAGELEGWLTSAPRWHLVGDEADPWHPVLREALDQPVEVVAPVPPLTLAALTAKRAAKAEATNNLLPPEFATRYQQQFVDRLWGRGLLAALAIYAVGLAIYFVALTVFSHLATGVQEQATAMSQTYTNSQQMKVMLGVLKERETLKFLALDCWKAVAEEMPSGLTLDTLNFNDGKTLSLHGTAPLDQVTTVTEFFDNLRKWKNGTQPMFDPSGGDPAPRINVNSGAATVTWSFELDLKQTGKP